MNTIKKQIGQPRRRAGWIMMLVMCIGVSSALGASLHVENISWLTIGKDSNDGTTGPNKFPIGCRVPNRFAFSFLQYGIALCTPEQGQQAFAAMDKK